MLRTKEFWIKLFITLNVYVVLRAFAVDDADTLDKLSFLFISSLVGSIIYDNL